MDAETSRFVSRILFRLPVMVSGGVASIVSVAGWLGLGEKWSPGLKLATTGALVACALLVGVTISALEYYRSASRDPARVRTVQRGAHYFVGSMMLILDRKPWIHIGQILTLYLQRDETEDPVCLLRVEASTSLGYPQASVWRLLGNIEEDLDRYFSAQREHLIAREAVSAEFFEGAHVDE